MWPKGSVIERPMIFKASIAQAHGSKGTFAPGFGVKIGDAVQASCSAYPYFDKKLIVTEKGERIELIRGEIVEMAPIGPPHEASVARLTTLLVQKTLGKAIVWPQNNSIRP